MFKQNGLSLDQAPPLTVVFSFFFLASLFGILAGVLLFFYGKQIFVAKSMAAVTFTHVLTLGVMLSFMFAALFQMLPVIAGVSLSSPQKRSKLLLYPFVLGVLSLLLAFNLSSSWLYILSGLLLGLALFGILIPMLSKLLTLQNHSPSSKGMTLSLLSLLLVLLLAFYLLFSLSGLNDATYYAEVKTAHYSFGLFAWITLLIISISFQTIEMFYVTPEYPKLVTKYLGLGLVLILFVSSVLSFFHPNIFFYTDILMLLMLSTYALLTLKRLSQKKRPLSDATVWFWRLGLVSLLFSMLSVLLQYATAYPPLKALSYIFFTSFALSIVFAMFYKIVPFLTWFHLNAQGYFTAPMMHEVIHPKTAKKHLYIHVTTLVTFLLSLYISWFIYLAAGLMILSFSWLAYQIIHAHHLYKETQKTGEKFSMNITQDITQSSN